MKREKQHWLENKTEKPLYESQVEGTNKIARDVIRDQRGDHETAILAFILLISTSYSSLSNLLKTDTGSGYSSA